MLTSSLKGLELESILTTKEKRLKRVVFKKFVRLLKNKERLSFHLLVLNICSKEMSVQMLTLKR
jgi:hypothetical protein